MGKRLLNSTLLSILLLNGCADHATQIATPDDNTILRNEILKLEARPENVTDSEIAWFLSAGAKPFPYNEGDQKPGIIMWQGPLRIAVVDGQGRDLNLAEYPGNVINTYVTSLADYAALPVTITKASKIDNNATIIVSTSELTGDAGTLFGVPELSARPHEKVSGILSASYSTGIGPETESEGMFQMGYVNMACAVHMVIPDGTRPHVNSVIGMVYGLLHLCLGPAGVFFNGPDNRPRAQSEEVRHSFYYWNVFYHSGLTPGMSQAEAERRILDYLRHSQP